MNFFSTLGIRETFCIDKDELRRAYTLRLRILHPDTSCGGNGSVELINKAYFALLDPIARGEHLLQINGLDPNSCSPEINMQMFEIREQYELSSAKDEFLSKLRSKAADLSQKLESLDINQDKEKFHKNFVFLRFISAFLDKVSQNAYSRD